MQKYLQNDEIHEHFTKFALKNAQIAIKQLEKEISPYKIRFETVLKHKNHEKLEKCTLRFGHSVD